MVRNIVVVGVSHACSGMVTIPLAGLITKLLGDGRIPLPGSNSSVGPSIVPNVSASSPASSSISGAQAHAHTVKPIMKRLMEPPVAWAALDERLSVFSENR